MFELQKRFSFFDNVSDTVQELGVFELQMNAACFDKDTCTVIEVRRIHTSKRFSLYSYRSLARSNSQEIQFVSTETVIGVWCARAQKGSTVLVFDLKRDPVCFDRDTVTEVRRVRTSLRLSLFCELYTISGVRCIRTLSRPTLFSMSLNQMSSVGSNSKGIQFIFRWRYN